MLRKICLALSATLASGWAAFAAPLEAYGRLPSIEQAVLSPSGELIAFVVTDGQKRTIAIHTASDRKLVVQANAGAQKVRDLTWADDDHLILTTSTTNQAVLVSGPRVENFFAQIIEPKSGQSRPLLTNVRTNSMTMNTVLSLPEVRTVDGKPVVFVRGVQFVDDRGRAGLFRVRLPSYETDIAEVGGRDVYDWVVDPQGRAIAQAAYDDVSAVWKLQLHDQQGWRTTYTLKAPIETPDFAGMGRDASTVLLEVEDDQAGLAWREVSAKTGAWGDAVAVGDNQTAIHDPATGLLIGDVVLQGDVFSYNFHLPRDAAVWRAVTKAFAGDVVTLESWSQDRRKIIVRVDSPTLGPAFSLIDRSTGQAAWLGPQYPLTEQDVALVKPIRYKAGDGLEITGYLTLPRGREVKDLPLIVLPHGGPASRDRPGFDWWAQALASRGYAVLQPNFRGSTGFGPAFYKAGFGEFGRKMQTDLSDGVRHLAREGVIDPKRVCIVGGSYGGYAALAGVTLDRGVYRCAVSYAGPSDLKSMFADSRRKGGRDALRYWQRFVGATSMDDAVLTQVSPAAHAQNVDVPVMLIHGRDDTVVTFSQTRKMAEALRAAGKPVEVVELKGEDHWLSGGETRLAMLKATVDFLERNNPPK